MTDAPLCSHCGKPVADSAYLCGTGTFLLERVLAEIPALSQELETTRLRQSRTGGKGVGFLTGTHERGLPWNVKAGEVADHLKVILVGWTRVTLDAGRGRMPQDSTPALALFLLSQREWLRHQHFAADVLSELTEATRPIRRIVDIAPDLAYAGVCSEQYPLEADGLLTIAECPQDLYAPLDKDTVTCPACDAQHDMKRRREVLLEAVEDKLLGASDLSRALTLYGEAVTKERIWKWRERGQLIPHPSSAEGEPVYLVSDVRRVVRDFAARKKAS